jgi:hypothetical protein
MPFLTKIAKKLTKHPNLKRNLKDAYQHLGNVLSDKKTTPSSIIQVSNDSKEHLFGYYDKSPWDSTGDRMIYLRVDSASKKVASNDYAEIILKTISTNKEKVIAKTKAWNVQQGSMIQWLGPYYNNEIIYNDYRDGEYCSVILNISEGNERVLPMPIYSVSTDGTVALTLDFARLSTFRPGYGYVNKSDKTANLLCPNTTCVWKLNLVTGERTSLFSYSDLYKTDTKENMESAYHKVNHIMINPSGNRFMFLHRWIQNGVKYDRLITANLEGDDLYVLLDEDMVSHCNWKDNNTIIAWANTHEFGNHYYILNDKSDKKKIFGKNQLIVDGHPSFSPNGKYMITDTYPNFKRKQKLILCDLENEKIVTLAEIYSSIKYKNETRCDLHPRWKRDSSEICFDGAQKKYRQVYRLKITD